MSIKQTNQKISSFFFVLQITWNVDFVISLNFDFKIPRAQSAIKKGGPHRHGGLLILFGICRENIFKILLPLLQGEEVARTLKFILTTLKTLNTFNDLFSSVCLFFEVVRSPQKVNFWW